jgi:hypothetical protein
LRLVAQIMLEDKADMKEYELNRTARIGIKGYKRIQWEKSPKPVPDPTPSVK